MNKTGGFIPSEGEALRFIGFVQTQTGLGDSLNHPPNGFVRQVDTLANTQVSEMLIPIGLGDIFYAGVICIDEGDIWELHLRTYLDTAAQTVQHYTRYHVSEHLGRAVIAFECGRVPHALAACLGAQPFGRFPVGADETPTDGYVLSIEFELLSSLITAQGM